MSTETCLRHLVNGLFIPDYINRILRGISFSTRLVEPVGIGTDRSKIATDSNGNTYLASIYSDTVENQNSNKILKDGIGNEIIEFSNTTFSTFLIKFDSSGNYLYARFLSLSNSNNSTDLGVNCDPSGNVYISGRYGDSVGITILDQDGITLGTLPASEPPISSDEDIRPSAYVIKFGSNGDYHFARILDTSGTDRAYSVTCDSAGSFYMAGLYDNRLTPPIIKGVENGSTTVSILGSLPIPEGSETGYVIKFDSSGRYLYARLLDSPNLSISSLRTVTCDSSGSLYMAGYYSKINNVPAPLEIKGVTNGTTTVRTLGVLPTNETDKRIAFMIKFDRLGKYLYARVLGDSDDDSEARDVICDPSGNVYLVGYYISTRNTLKIKGVESGGSTTVSTLGVLPISSDDGEETAFMLKFDTLGRYLYARVLGSSYGRGVACDRDGSVYFVGDYDNINLQGRNINSVTASVTPTVTTVGVLDDNDATAFMIKFNSVGTYLYSRMIDSVRDITCTSVVCDSVNSVFISGGYTTSEGSPRPRIINQDGVILGVLPPSVVGAAFVARFDSIGGYTVV